MQPSRALLDTLVPCFSFRAYCVDFGSAHPSESGYRCMYFDFFTPPVFDLQLRDVPVVNWTRRRRGSCTQRPLSTG